MELTVREDGDSWVGELEDLSEPECDVSRNYSVTNVPLTNGAYSCGTSYHKADGEFSARVRADSQEAARRAAKAYYEAIQDELEQRDED